MIGFSLLIREEDKDKSVAVPAWDLANVLKNVFKYVF